jgi:hypothetical protein
MEFLNFLIIIIISFMIKISVMMESGQEIV